ncbi:MAG: hybrid sensor histidine kinase/response regulator, partial [Candidatus Omnitrophica bacterium]|nr:hybrid sensor histidine kinase/response regulator [Candidatus Omnitrophota bacterium]
MAFDKSRFIVTYKTETKEHIQKLNLGLLQLEKAPQDKDLLDSMMREAHTIKGSSTMMGYKRIADIAHQMEDGLEKALNKAIILKKEHFDILFKCLDAIEPLLEDKVTWEDKGIESPFVKDLCQEASDIFSGKFLKEEIAKPETSPAKEAISAPHTEKKSTPDSAPQKAVYSAPVSAEESMRVDIDELDKIVNVSGANKTNASQDREGPLGIVTRDLIKVSQNIDFLSKNMQEEVMKIRMVPVSYLFNTFPRAMRDLARTKGKEINFVIKGEETRIDKAILDKIKDPLMHLLRNAIDHGIESKDARLKSGKPEQGNVILSASQEGSHIAIEVSDDGVGIDVARVKEIAIQQGIIAKAKAADLTDEEAYQILFAPSFTTKNEVTETSGRGVGLDVVREAVVQLKGMVEVKSGKNIGSEFILRLPLTLAIAESLLVGAGSDIFAIPIDTVVETIRISPEDIKSVESKDAITVRNQILPLVRLNDIFSRPKKGILEKRFMPLVVVQSVEKKIGLLVDDLIGRQSIISKNIRDPLKNLKHISGATILGNGRVILILDVPSIIESSEGIIIKRAATSTKPSQQSKKKKSILLAEDVLTTAMLEKNILESVGYSVVIARDGKEALDRAKQE